MGWMVERMRDLAVRFDVVVRAQVSPTDELIGPAKARGSVLRDPAGEATIAAAEKRLGVRLPPSYRAFLAVSDGAYASTMGAEIAREDVNGHALFGAAQLVSASEGDPDGVDLWADEFGSPDGDLAAPEAGQGVEVDNYTPYRSAVLLHAVREASVLALVPVDGEQEWQLWSFSKYGATAWVSFGDCLETWVRQCEASMPPPPTNDELVAQAEAGSLRAVNELVMLGDPRGGALLLASADAPRDETERRGYVAVLEMLGDPAAIELIVGFAGPAQPYSVRRNAIEALRRLDPVSGAGQLRLAAEEYGELARWARATLVGGDLSEPEVSATPVDWSGLTPRSWSPDELLNLAATGASLDEQRTALLQALLADEVAAQSIETLAPAIRAGVLFVASPAGASRVGGPEPIRFPKDVPWPQGYSGPLPYIGEIDFASISQIERLPMLPAAGRLLIFVDYGGGTGPEGTAVVWAPPGSETVLMSDETHRGPCGNLSGLVMPLLSSEFARYQGRSGTGGATEHSTQHWRRSPPTCGRRSHCWGRRRSPTTTASLTASRPGSSTTHPTPTSRPATATPRRRATAGPPCCAPSTPLS